MSHVIGEEFTQIVRVTPASHRVHPDPQQDYGVSSAEILFVLRGPLGAISWEVLSGWMLPETWAWWAKRIETPGDVLFGEPLPDSQPKGSAIALHAAAASSDHPRRHEKMCEWIGGPCWYENLSYLWGDALMDKLIAEGDAAVWARLRELYDRYLAEIPDPAETSAL